MFNLKVLLRTHHVLHLKSFYKAVFIYASRASIPAKLEKLNMRLARLIGRRGAMKRNYSDILEGHAIGETTAELSHSRELPP